jgi:hypothetical protein
MCLIIADNSNVHSFSLKPVLFGKKTILEQKWPFKENLTDSIILFSFLV